MALVNQELLDRLPAGIGRLVARIADSDDETANTLLALFLMFMHRHGQTPDKISIKP